MKLSELKRSNSGIIISINYNKKIKSKIIEIGPILNKKALFLYVTPFGKEKVFLIGNTLFSIPNKIAENIFIN